MIRALTAICFLATSGCSPFYGWVLKYRPGDGNVPRGGEARFATGQCVSIHKRTSFLMNTDSVSDAARAAEELRELLQIDIAEIDIAKVNSGTPTAGCDEWIVYAWIAANLAACNGNEALSSRLLERLTSLKPSVAKTCRNGIWVDPEVKDLQMMTDAQLVLFEQSGGMKGDPKTYHRAYQAAARQFEVDVNEARRSREMWDRIDDAVRKGLTSAGVSSGDSFATAGLRALQGSRNPGGLPAGSAAIVSGSAGASGGLACADNGASCNDDPSVREWTGRCQTQLGAQGPCHCSHAAIFKCYLAHGCYRELAGERAASVPRARLEASLRESLALASNSGTSCTLVPGPEQPVFRDEAQPPPRRPLVPSSPPGSPTNQDCDVPAGATACPAF